MKNLPPFYDRAENRKFYACVVMALLCVALYLATDFVWA